MHEMKSCDSDNGAAYSRPVRALVGTARSAVRRKRRGRPMGRCPFHHPFVSIFCVSLSLLPVPCISAGTTLLGHAAAPVVEVSPQPSPQSAPSESQNREQTKTEQYTLSHERQAKAVAYSRAGYTLYFVSYFLGGLLLFLILRLGWAARFRDIAEHVSDKKWIQGLVFVPLLFLTIGVLKLPLHRY